MPVQSVDTFLCVETVAEEAPVSCVVELYAFLNPRGSLVVVLECLNGF